MAFYDFHVIDSQCDCIEVYFTGNNYCTVVKYVSTFILINELLASCAHTQNVLFLRNDVLLYASYIINEIIFDDFIFIFYLKQDLEKEVFRWKKMI